jgi:hypothetical protein
MEDKNIVKELESMEKWLNEVSENNNHEIDQTAKLKIILFNLKIVGANVKGIEPITDELQKIITSMHDNTFKMVTEGRKELRQAFKNVKEYIMEKEGIKND